MRPVRLAAVVLAGVLALPLPALAAVCFTDSELGATYVVEILGSAGRSGGPGPREFIAVVGEARRDCVEFQGAPLTGTARERADGTVQVAIQVLSATSACSPYVLQGALDPPGFDSGTGFFIETPGLFFRDDVTITPVPCPVLD
jgi:hypothetical protein